jgi:hypothetical protein
MEHGFLVRENSIIIISQKIHRNTRKHTPALSQRPAITKREEDEQNTTRRREQVYY